MKKNEFKVATDHVEMQIVYFEPEESDFQPGFQGVSRMMLVKPPPQPYLMIGPPGGPLARIDEKDVEIVLVMLQRIRTRGYMPMPMAAMRPMPPDGGGGEFIG